MAADPDPEVDGLSFDVDSDATLFGSALRFFDRLAAVVVRGAEK